jgi:hypothetical protein
MAFTQIYTVVARDSGVLTAGLSPTLIVFKYVDGNSAGTAPTVTAVGNGIYQFTIDWSARPAMDIAYVCDFTGTIAAASERYVPGVAEVSKMQTAFLFHLTAGRSFTDLDTGELSVTVWDGSQVDREGIVMGVQLLKDGFAAEDTLDNNSTRIIEKKSFAP